MKQLRSIFYFVLLLMLVAACSSNENESGYSAKNELFLSTPETNILEDNEGARLSVNLLLTKALKEDLTLTFDINNNLFNEIAITSFEQNPIVIKVGEKTATLILQSNNKGVLSEELTVEVRLKNSSDPDITLNKPILITVKPNANAVSLTEAQKALLEGYKANNMDISKWIGLVPVKVKVLYPGNGAVSSQLKPYEKTFEGKTSITLSESATADKIVLKMVNNAMGIENYLYGLMRDLTILDSEFWYDPTNPYMPPAAKTIVDLIGLSADRAESFVLGLDNLGFNLTDSSIDFVGKTEEGIVGVDFQYTYSAWDRLKKLIDEGNQDAIDAYAQCTPSVNPALVFNRTSIDKDDWDVNYWTEAKSSFDLSTGKMSFIFNLDHENGGDYMIFEVTYSFIE